MVSNSIGVYEAVIQLIAKEEELFKDKGVSFTGHGVSPHSRDGHNRNFWDRVEVIMKSLHVALLSCVMNEAAIKSGTACVRARVQLRLAHVIVGRLDAFHGSVVGAAP